jgi:hypothetical protein
LSFGELHIPMLVWGNRAFREALAPAFGRLREHSGEPLTQGVTFPTMLSLAGITYPGMDHSRDLTSEAYVPPGTFQVMAPDGRMREIKP